MQKLRFTLFFLLVSFAFTLQAAWLSNFPQTITQPNGTVVQCFATGDEFYNWLHDANGFTIIQNHANGFYTYATLVDGKLEPSAIIAGKDDPSSAGLQPGINIPVEKMQAIRSEFMKTQMPAPPAIPSYNLPKSRQNIGTMNNLVVYIRFSDQDEFTEDTTVYSNLFNNTTPGFNSMVNYFKFASYEKLTLPSYFYPIPPEETVISYQDIYPRSYFMPYNSVTNPNGYQEGEAGEREHALLKRAVAYIESEVPDNLDIDYNQDGYVDNVVFIIRGGTTAWATLLWPHRWVLYNEDVYINGKRVWDYNFQLTSSLQSSGTGVLCHEMFHSLGSPDLYHYNSTPVDPIGTWDIMCSDRNPPQLMGAYLKFRYGGWIDQIPEITECGTYTLNPLALEGNNCFKIASPNSGTDFFVFEYRKKEGTFEGLIPASGLLIYKINTLQDGEGNAQGPPDEVYIYRPNGTLEVNGNLNEAVFAEDYGRTEFNDNSNPMCFLSNGLPGGLDISNVGMIGETISFDVTIEKAPIADFSASATLITVGCATNFTDLSLCNVDSWEWTFTGGNPATSTQQNPEGIVYENEGVYPVMLMVTNAWGNNTKVYQNMITVSTSALPVVNIVASDSIVCTGEVVTFTDLSEVCPIAWNWEITPVTGFEFVNGTSANSQIPQVIFNAPYPTYSVKLSVTNNNGVSQIFKPSWIFAGGLIAPDYSESFEGTGLSALGWTVENPDNKTTWQIFDVGGSGAGTHAAGINLYTYFSYGQRDRMISPPINMMWPGNYYFSFKHAYAQTNLQYSDSLIVKISTDCGATWTRILAVAEDGTGNFATTEPLNNSFIPMLPADWCGQNSLTNCYTLDISEFSFNSNVKIMFESVRVTGNNLFIDDIKMEAFVGVDNPEQISNSAFSLYPNPAQGIFTVSFENAGPPCKLEIYNTQGQMIRQVQSNSSNTTQTLNLDLSVQPRGLYFVRMTGNSVSETQKLILE
jgi:M6 family metalloprotease-like protein